VHAHLMNVRHCQLSWTANYVRSIRKMYQYSANKSKLVSIIYELMLFDELHVFVVLNIGF